MKKDGVNWTDISADWDNPTPTDITFIDLFCGAGGLSKGLEMAGLHGICGCDFFPEAVDTYRRNFRHPCIQGDITKQETKNLLYSTIAEELSKCGRDSVDIVAGGFPC